jgi:hypothetical protein
MPGAEECSPAARVQFGAGAGGSGHGSHSVLEKDDLYIP